MKKVRKLIPVSLYDIPGLERWLEEQAGQGLFPVHLGSWATFEAGGVPGTRFRLDPFGKSGGEPAPEQLELYRQAGWEYALSIGRAYFLFYTADPAAPELYSDWESRGLSLDRMAKRVNQYTWRRRILWGLLGLLLVWVLFFFQSKYDLQPPDRFVRLPLLLVEFTSPAMLFFLAGAAFSWWSSRRDRRTLTAIHRALSRGLPPPPSPGPSRRIQVENLLALVLVVPLALVLLWSRFGPSSTPLDRFSRPYVALAQLEEEPLFSYEELFGEPVGNSPFHQGENQAEVHFSLLAPVWYTVSEDKNSAQAGTQANAFSPDPQGGKYRYSPNLDSAYFHLLFPALAGPVARAQLDQFRLVNLRWTYQQVQYPGLDLVILADEPDGIWQMAAVARGNRLAVFRYAGQERLAGHLAQLAAAVGA